MKLLLVPLRHKSNFYSHMEVIIFEKETYYKILAEIKKTVADAVKEAGSGTIPPPEKDEWVPAKEAQRILKCKKDKLRTIRDKGLITVSVSGGTILYQTSSLYDYHKRNIMP